MCATASRTAVFQWFAKKVWDNAVCHIEGLPLVTASGCINSWRIRNKQYAPLHTCRQLSVVISTPFTVSIV